MTSFKEIYMENLIYNSQMEKLEIPEYGRNVQTLIRHAKEITDLDERQFFVEKVVHLMMQMHPQNKNLDDYRDKMWKHVFRIANFDLPGVIPPNGAIPTPENTRKRPDRVPYPFVARKFRHYGHHVQTLIDKAIEMEDGEVKKGFVQVIGSYMKLAYRTWNKDHYVSDDLIIEELESLSKGKLKLEEDARLDSLSQSSGRSKSRSNERGGRDNRSDYRDNNRSGGRSNDRRENRGGARGGYDRDNRGGGSNSGGGRGGYDRDNRGGGRDNRGGGSNSGGGRGGYDRDNRGGGSNSGGGRGGYDRDNRGGGGSNSGGGRGGYDRRRR
ncbi:MAG: hypothetical protein ACI9XO_000499 [Paraglaciecola sp.]